MQITENFERWWRETGQFIEPCGSNASLIDHCKDYAKNLAANIEAEFEAEFEAESKELRDELHDLEEKSEDDLEEVYKERDSFEYEVDDLKTTLSCVREELDQANDHIHDLKQRIAELENANRNQ